MRDGESHHMQQRRSTPSNALEAYLRFGAPAGRRHIITDTTSVSLASYPSIRLVSDGHDGVYRTAPSIHIDSLFLTHTQQQHHERLGSQGSQFKAFETNMRPEYSGYSGVVNARRLVRIYGHLLDQNGCGRKHLSHGIKQQYQ